MLGTRFKGEILPGAMPWTNRYIGNPILTGMLNVIFGAHVSDAHCGLRALRRDVGRGSGSRRPGWSSPRRW